MSYARVIPRDLFNEGNLLTCLGRLWIKLDERRDHFAKLDLEDDGRFEIAQNPSDGSIRCLNVELLLFASAEDRERNIDALPVSLWRPLNSRDKWPLWARFDDEDDLRVFDLDGELSPEFWIAITEARP